MPVLIALVTGVAFLPTLDNEFVNWDDEINLVDNPHYRGLGWTQLRWMWSTVHMGHWIPLTWMTFGLDYLLWGMHPVGYHLTNLLLHIANAAAFYFLARRLLGLALSGLLNRDRVGLPLSAGFASLFFALHPLRVESVAWATERRDVLVGLFYLLALLAYFRACELGERGQGWYWGSLGLFVAALLSKSMAVSLPVVLLILDTYPLRRLGWARGWWGKQVRWVYMEKLPFVFLAVAATVIAFPAVSRLNNMSTLDQLSVLDRLAVSAYGLSFYLWKTIVPLNLSPLYEMPVDLDPWAGPFILSYGVVLAVTVVALACRRQLPGLPAVWLAYVVILLPVIGIFHNGPQIAADRYTYLAGSGWAIVAGAFLLSCWQERRFLVLRSAAMCILAGLGVLTWNQTRVWHDSETLWTHVLATYPKSAFAENNLGVVLAQRGKWVEAIEHYRQALRINPDHASAHNNWGAALARQGKLDEAIERYRKALQIRPDYADAHFAWGNTLTEQGKPAEAIEHYAKVLQIKPDDARAHTTWGNALGQQGKWPEAIEHYRQAVGLRPDYADAHYNWGNALIQQGKPAEAIDHYAKVLQIRPDDARAHTNWGVALALQSKLAEAVEQYRKALHVEPDHAAAHYNWANALAVQGKLAEAVEHYRQALRIRPDYADAHYNWGNALAQQGKLAEATEHYRQALQIRPDYAEAQSNLVNALRRIGAGKEDTTPSRKGENPE
jgi:tetratricopeptide (TPR) repeat protein